MYCLVFTKIDLKQLDKIKQFEDDIEIMITTFTISLFYIFKD